MIQLIREPTRVTESPSTLIDLLYVTGSVWVRSSGTICVGHISDHNLIFCKLNAALEELNKNQ